MVSRDVSEFAKRILRAQANPRADVSATQLFIMSGQRGDTFRNQVRREVQRIRDLKTSIGSQPKSVAEFKLSQQAEAGVQVSLRARELGFKSTKAFLESQAQKRQVEKKILDIKKIREQRLIEQKKRLPKVTITQLPPTKLPPPQKRIIPTDKKKFISFDKELLERRGKRVKGFFRGDVKDVDLKKAEEILQMSIDPSLSFFGKQALIEEAKIKQDIDKFSQQRLNFFQNQINEGKISVEEANKKLQIEINNKQEKIINQSEFFKKDGPSKRDSTLNPLSF